MAPHCSENKAQHPIFPHDQASADFSLIHHALAMEFTLLFAISDPIQCSPALKHLYFSHPPTWQTPPQHLGLALDEFL